MSRRRGQRGRPHSRGVHNMLSMLDRLEVIEVAERGIGRALQESIRQHDGEVTMEIHDLLSHLEELNEQYARLSLRIVFAYAYLGPVQRARVNTLRRAQIMRLRLLWVFMGVTRLR